MKTIGICFGGYCPLHRGHLDLIMRAKKENDKCLIIVCGYNGEPRTEELGLTLEDKEYKIKNIFKEDEIVEVTSINDSDLGIDESMSVSNWRVWTREVMKHVPSDYIPIFYVAEPFYRESLEKCGYQVKLFPRILGISGTEIRRNPCKNWSYIHPEFRDIFTKNILITGTASEGKTNLCRDLSIYFGFPWIFECGRNIMENRCIKDPDLDLNLFIEFLSQQSGWIDKYQGRAPILFCDTDNLVTLMYAHAYSTDPGISKFSEKDYKELVSYHNLFRGVIRWDKIYLLPPKNDFVDDGTRYMKQSTMAERNKNYKFLCKLLEENNLMDKVEILRGDYYENFDTVKRYVDSHF